MSAARRSIRARSWYEVSAQAGWAAFAVVAARATSSGVEPVTVAIRRPVAGSVSSIDAPEPGSQVRTNEPSQPDAADSVGSGAIAAIVSSFGRVGRAGEP